MRFPRHFLGLPLHPMLVHFPLAFWLLTPFCDVLALASGESQWWSLAIFLSALGCATGAFAVLTGLLDFVHLSDTGSNDVRLAARHGVRTSLAWCIMSGKLLAIALSDHSTGVIWASLGADILACLLLMQATIFGTRITYGR